MKQNNKLTLQKFLPYRISVLANTISSMLASLYTDKFGISIPEWRTIAVLGETPGLTSTQIAMRVAMDKVGVTRAVQSLVEKRLIRRSSSQTDGRVSFLTLTSHGRRVYSEVVPMALAFEQEVWGTMKPSEQDNLVTLLAKLELHVEKLRSERAATDHGIVQGAGKSED